MAIARGLERRLERLFEGAAGRVFSGKLHASELAGRLAREADLARFEHATGPATANRYVITVNDEDLRADHRSIAHDLSSVVEEYASENGLRLEGPAEVSIRRSADVSRGQFSCTAEVSPGPIARWSRLKGETLHELSHNRVMIGRSDDTDIRLDFHDVSRQHAVLWREHGRAWIRDLGSSNGTKVDGSPVGSGPARLEHGSMVTLAAHAFRFLEG